MKQTEPHFKLSSTLYPSKPQELALLEFMKQRKEQGSTVSATIKEALTLLAKRSLGDGRAAR